MGQVCKVCQHSNKKEIDRELIQGKSKSGISRKYNVPYGSVDYHSQHHLSRQLATAYEMKEMDESNNLLARIEDILSKAELIFTRNFEKEKDTIALKALSESRGALELMARIAAHLHQARAAELENTNGPTTFTVTVTPDDEADPMELASEKLTASEFHDYMRLTEKIQGGDVQTGEYAYQNIDPSLGMAHDVTDDPCPLKSIRVIDEESLSPDPDPDPEPSMVRTKKPQVQCIRQMESQQIPGPSSVSGVIISRRTRGIAYLE